MINLLFGTSSNVLKIETREKLICFRLLIFYSSATKWQRFFKSRFLSVISKQAQIYFYLLLGVLVIFLLEAIREMRKYSHTHGKLHENLYEKNHVNF